MRGVLGMAGQVVFVWVTAARADGDAPIGASVNSSDASPTGASASNGVPIDTTTALAAPVTPPTGSVEDKWQRSVERDGPVFLGGVVAGDGNTMWRVDALMPIRVAQAPALRAGIELGYDHEAAAIPELAVEAYVVSIFPTAFYDWKLPIRSAAGDFVASVEGGLGVVIARMKIDEPFMPGSFETLHAFALHLAGALQFRARAGWVISFQPLGIDVPVGDIDAPPNVEVRSKTSYEIALLAGYQFQ